MSRFHQASKCAFDIKLVDTGVTPSPLKPVQVKKIEVQSESRTTATDLDHFNDISMRHCKVVRMDRDVKNFDGRPKKSRGQAHKKA